MRSVAEIIKDVSEMPLEAQNQISAHLLRLRRQRDEDWRRRMADKIDDRDTSRWVGLDQLQDELGRAEVRP